MELEIECRDCQATGLYSGIAEAGSCAIVCHTCRGTGKERITVTAFSERRRRGDITKVFPGSFGICHGDESPGGCSYEEWWSGATPAPCEEYYCPYIFDNRGMSNKPLERCRQGIEGFGSIRRCLFYGEKEICWREYWEKQKSGVK